MLRENNQTTNVSPNNRGKIYKSIPLCQILTISARVPLWEMARKKMDIFPQRREITNSKWVGVVFELKSENSFNDQIDKCWYSKFYSKTSKQMRKTLKRDNTRVISIIIFYENRQLLIFKVFSVVVYWFLDK